MSTAAVVAAIDASQAVLLPDDDETVPSAYVVDDIVEVDVEQEPTLIAESSAVPAEAAHYALDDEDEDDGDPNDYGGMPLHIYDAIVDFKQTARYPEFLRDKGDRSAHTHWRVRCAKFMLMDDSETLVYYTPHNERRAETIRVVVKKGETRRVLERVHDLIGHLGTKRTQTAVQRRLYWRSIRRDVARFVSDCAFCREKKVRGQKLVRAPINILAHNCYITVRINQHYRLVDGGGERLQFELPPDGALEEDEVREIAFTHMTSYTFKETAHDARRTSLRSTASAPLRHNSRHFQHHQQALANFVPTTAATATTRGQQQQQQQHQQQQLYATLPLDAEQNYFNFPDDEDDATVVVVTAENGVHPAASSAAQAVEEEEVIEEMEVIPPEAMIFDDPVIVAPPSTSAAFVHPPEIISPLMGPNDRRRPAQNQHQRLLRRRRRPAAAQILLDPVDELPATSVDQPKRPASNFRFEGAAARFSISLSTARSQNRNDHDCCPRSSVTEQPKTTGKEVLEELVVEPEHHAQMLRESSDRR